MKKIILLLVFFFPIFSFGQYSGIRTIEIDTSKIRNNTKLPEKLPQFSGNVRVYLAEHIEYPEFAIKNNIEGRVVLTFVVDYNGQISDVKIKKGIGYGCDAEAMRVVKGMPKWKPAIKDGKPVNMYYSLSVNFALNREE